MNLNFKEIIEGWRNDLIPPKDLKDMIEEVAKERLEICAGCPFQSDNAKKNGHTSIRFDLHCISCGCPLKKKTKSLSSECPQGKWLAVTNDADRYEIEKTIKENETQDNGLQDGSTKSSEGTSEGLPQSDTV